jgi:FkbM family methyltransferase
MNPVTRMLRALSLLANRRSWGPFVEAAEISGFDHGFTISWSQKGEDIALLSIFEDMPAGSYMDIGAHHPSRFSVTRHLYQRGWHGVNVEANQSLIKAFMQDRPRDVNVCIAVGEKDNYEFTIFDEPAISTINSDWKNKFLSEKNQILRTENVVGRKLRALYDEHFPSSPVDLLTIDAEGSDFEVLASMDFESLEESRFPHYLMLETAPPVEDSLSSPSVILAKQHGYIPWMILPMATILKSPKS